MRATGLTLTAFGESPRLATVDIPDLAAGQLLIEVKASSINAFDGKVADGALRHAFEYDFRSPSAATSPASSPRSATR